MFKQLIQRPKCLHLKRNAIPYGCQLRQVSDTTGDRTGGEDGIASWFTSTESDQLEERVVKRPVSYLPDHLGQTRKWIKQKPWWRYKYFINVNPLDNQKSEWTQTPEYPPLGDASRDGQNKDIRLEWYDAIRRLPSAQQKEYEICRHYYHLSYILEPVMPQYNALALHQFITRTHLISGHMPSSYDQMDVNSILDPNLKQSILDSICLHLFQTNQRKPSFEFKTANFSTLGFPDPDLRVDLAKQEDTIEDVIGIVRRALQPKYQHLSQIQMDVNPYVVSSWFHNDYPTPFIKKKWFPNDTHDQQFTYKSTHSFNMRAEKPLPPAISLEDDICLKSEIPEYKYRLLNFGYPLRRQSLSTLPGFWSDRSNGFDFANLICHTRHPLKLRERINDRSFDDDQQVLDGMAISSSFAWLHSLASNLGFSIFHELTYPLVTHAIITDGQFWSFYVYQLNTHCFHSDIDNNLLRNVCWSSGELKLFDSYENGQLIGVNDEVLKLLVKFMAREPQVSDNCVLRPYLSEDQREERDKEELSYSLRRKYGNYRNPWVLTRQKVHLWEKIYKYHKDATPIPHIKTRPKITFKYPPFFKR